MSRRLKVWSLALAATMLSTLVFTVAGTKASAASQPSMRDRILASPTQKVDPRLTEALANLPDDKVLGVMVAVNDQEFRDSDMYMLRDLGFAPITRVRVLPMAYAIGPKTAIEPLFNNPRIRRVQLDKEIHYNLNRSTAAIKANEVWDRFIKKNDEIKLPVDGNGVGIAVIDTGVDALHNDLEYGRTVRANYRMIQTGLFCAPATGCTGQQTNDPHDAPPVGDVFFDGIDTFAEAPNTDLGGVGHGTHVSSIAAGSGSASNNSSGASLDGSTPATSRRGVAPGAKIIGIGVGAGTSAGQFFFGYDLLYQQIKFDGNPLNIRVVNNSYGDGGGEYDPADFIHQALNILTYDLGLHMVFSGGNNGDTGPKPVSSMARVPAVIGVAGTSADGTTMASFSSRGTATQVWTHPDLAAPGEGIFGAAAYAMNVPTDYIGMSGTSMSAPHVTGTIALMLQACPTLGFSSEADDIAGAPAGYLDPFSNKITNAEWILKKTATHMSGSLTPQPGTSYLPGQTTSKDDGYGLINAHAAVDLAFRFCQAQQANPAATVTDALALPSVASNAVEAENKVNELQFAYSGKLTGTSAHPLLYVINGHYPFTVPTTWEAITFDVRWRPPAFYFGMDDPAEVPEPVDLNIAICTASTGTTKCPAANGYEVITISANPTVEGTKSIKLSAADLAALGAPQNPANRDAPATPWYVAVVADVGAKVKVEFEVEATLGHSGHWDVPAPSTVYNTGTAATIHGGSWLDADNGAGATMPGTHLVEDLGDTHNVSMRYWDLGGNSPSLLWSSKQASVAAPVKQDITAYDEWRNHNISTSPLWMGAPTLGTRVGDTAWRSWHTQAIIPTPTPTPTGSPTPTPTGSPTPTPTPTGSPTPTPTATPTPTPTPIGNTSILNLTGPSSGQFGDSIQASAQLLLNGSPASGRQVDFALGALTASATTNGSGVATVNFTPNAPAMNVLSASYTGTDGFPNAIDSQPFTTLKEATELSLASTTNGSNGVFRATLTDDDATPNALGGETITFGDGALPIGTAVTDSNGVAELAVASPTAMGSYTADFAGGPFYDPSNQATNIYNPLAVTLDFVTNPVRPTNVTNISASGTVDPGSSVQVVFDDGLRQVASTATVAAGNWSTSGVDLTPLANGPITVTAYATGPISTAYAVGNTTKSTNALRPQIEIIGDAFGYLAPPQDLTSVPVKVTHTGPQPTASIDVEICDTANTCVSFPGQSVNHSETITLTFDATPMVDGIIIGTANNAGQVAQTSAKLDRNGPTTTIDTPGLPVVISTPLISSMTFTGNAVDATTDILYVRVSLRQGTKILQSLNAVKLNRGTNVEWEIDFTHFDLLMPGTYSLEAFSVDAARNTGPLTTKSFTVI